MSKSASAAIAATVLILSCTASAASFTTEREFRQQADNRLQELRASRPEWQQSVRQPLRQIWQAKADHPDDWHQRVASPGNLRDDGRVHVEIRHDPADREALIDGLASAGASIRYQSEQGGWLEALIPLDQLDAIADLPEAGSIGLARLPAYDGATTTSEAVALGNADLWHQAGLGGSGVVIAVIDAFLDTEGQIAALQDSGDWPGDDQLTRHARCGDEFGHPEDGMLLDPPPHGNGVVEVIYDLAPEAHYNVYDPCGAGPIIAAMQEAVSDGADIINLSLSIPADTPGDGSAPAGSLAEAIEQAHNEGVLVVISAGNSRMHHWGGPFDNPNGSGPGSFHHWWDNSLEWANHVLISDSECIANGESLSGTLYWNDWVEPENDYDLVLWRFDNDTSAPFAVSDDEQSGAVYQLPRESISTLAHTDSQHAACQPGEARYAWVIKNIDAGGDHNFRFWSANLEHRTTASTLSTPADSTAALTVGSVHAGSGNLAAFSGEGPMLSTGGGVPAGNEYPKPDVVSYSGVSNTTYGTFAGTSVSAPHVSGMAALLMQRHRWLYENLDSQEIAQRIRDIGQLGDNDLAPPGHDFRAGWGLLRFQVETTLSITRQPPDGLVNHPLSPAMAVEILDGDGLPILSGPSHVLDVEFGQDPSQGSANLFKPFPHPVIDGATVFGGLIIDYPGIGYTLIATSEASGLAVESSPFDLVEEIFSDKFEQ